MVSRLLQNAFTRTRQPRIGCNHQWIVGHDPGGVETFARQIKPADPGIFVNVAQDVGQLERAAEMMRKQDTVFLAEAEHPHGEPPHCARDAIAIEIERPRVGRADVGGNVHFHAIDDGDEVFTPQAEPFHRWHIVAQMLRWFPGIKRIDIAPPLIQRLEAFRARTIGVGDVIDLTAETVDIEHRIALFARQDTHRRVE